MRHHLPFFVALALGIILSPRFCGEARAESGESDFLSRTRQLTFEGRRAGEGYWSPDDGRLVFQSERVEGNPFYQIFVLDMQSGESELVSPGIGKTTCAFFDPTGEKILFASTHLDPDAEQKQREELDFRASGQQRRYSWDYDEHFDLFVREGDEIQRLTDARGYDAEGSYSPDGKWIAFTSMRDAYTGELSETEREKLQTDLSYFGEIYIMPATGGEAKRLTRTPGYDGGPFFTPDGTRIIWRRFDEEGLIADIWTMDLDGGNPRQITDFDCMSWAPYVHPSGDYVFFAANKLGFTNFEIYIVDFDGARQPVRVTYTDRFDGLPVPSHDGRRIAFTSSRRGGDGAQLFLSEWNHEAALKALSESPLRSSSK